MKWSIAKVLLITSNAVLVCSCLWRLMDGPEDIQIEAAQAPRSIGLHHDFVPPALSSGAIQTAAIFHESRQFYAPQAVGPIEQAAPPYRLAGAMLMPRRSVAHLIHTETQARTKVSIGETLEGWVVIEITARRVVLQQGARTVDIAANSSPASAGVKTVSSIPQAEVVAPALQDAPQLYRPPPTQN